MEYKSAKVINGRIKVGDKVFYKEYPNEIFEVLKIVKGNNHLKVTLVLDKRQSWVNYDWHDKNGHYDYAFCNANKVYKVK